MLADRATQSGGRAIPPDQILRVGLIGCGGRGSGAASQALAADPMARLTAMGDAFPDQLAKSLANLQQVAPKQLAVPPERRFTGFDAYAKVINSGVDVVVLATPPGFRPLHLRAAVAEGKHVFCEKPMAVDAPGVRSVLESAAEAKRKNLSLVSGFGWRKKYASRIALNKIHQGAIGEILAIHSVYHTGPLWSFPRQSDWSDMVWQMRNWYYFTWLSGDHIVEQAVHSIDKMAWVMQDVPPLRATAQGGRQSRTSPEFGHIFDHFSVVYEYPNGVRGYLSTRQQAGCANDISDWIVGSKGVCRIGRTHSIKGETDWHYQGPENNSLQTEHDELFAAIRAGTPLNEGVWMAQSTMQAILGRMAAYTGQTISWEQALNSKEDLTPARYAWDLPLAVPPVAIPGQTKFV